MFLGVSIPKMQFRNRSVLVYQEAQTDGKKVLQAFRSQNMKLQQGKQYSGRLTIGAKKRLAKAVTLLVQGTKKRWIVNPVTKKTYLHQLSFMTLTVSDHTQLLNGKEAHKTLLAPFLAWLRKTKGVNTYIWKAELHKDGQLHYHITLPDFIHYREIRNKWNELQRKAGLLERYAQGHGHYDPNSTDMHKVYKIKDVAGYLLKEITKGMQNETSLGGKVWDCSENLSQSSYYCQNMEQSHYLDMERAVEEKLATKFEGERFTIYKFFEPVEEYLLSAEDLSHYEAWLYKLQDSISFCDP